jgi:nucleoside-diphosphate-sugar epimerase
LKTVVTGGTGFIGSHLVKKLVEDGRQVCVASDLSRIGLENLLELGIQIAGIDIRDTDLTHYSQALKAVDGADTVFHLAARIGNMEYLHGNETAEMVALQQNLTIDANVFRACVEKGIRNLVYASSVAVYSMVPQLSYTAVFKESDLNISHNQITSFTPDGGYGWSKLMGEIQLGWTRSIDIGIARIYSVYGINEPIETKKAHVVGDLIRKVILLSSGNLQVHGDGNQSRDFLYVSDCVAALVHLEKKAVNPPVTVNIGAGIPVSISSLAHKIVKISGKNIKIEFDTSKPMGPISRSADITRARAVLGWQPAVDLDEGLRRTYIWIENKLRKSDLSK